MSRARVWLTSLCFLVAGVLFIIYPAVRPFSSEKGLEGGAAFGSTGWVVAHSFAVVGFILLVLGLFGIYLRVQRSASEGLALAALVLSWIGIGLTLPFYGAEVFGLHAIGQRALHDNNPDLVSLASAVRGEPGIWFIVIGLVLLGLGVILATIAMWRSGLFRRWIGIPLALGFALYLPQYQAPQVLRVAHGALITVGCALIAWDLLSRASDRARPAGRRQPD